MTSYNIDLIYQKYRNSGSIIHICRKGHAGFLPSALAAGLWGRHKDFLAQHRVQPGRSAVLHKTAVANPAEPWSTLRMQLVAAL